MAITGTIATIAALGYGVYSGERAHDMQKRARSAQQAAQSEAKQSALSQQIRADQAAAAANRKQPDVASLLAFEQQAGATTPLLNSGRRGGRSRPTLLGDA